MVCALLDIEKPTVRKLPWKMSFHQLWTLVSYLASVCDTRWRKPCHVLLIIGTSFQPWEQSRNCSFLHSILAWHFQECWPHFFQSKIQPYGASLMSSLLTSGVNSLESAFLSSPSLPEAFTSTRGLFPDSALPISRSHQPVAHLLASAPTVYRAKSLAVLLPQSSRL